MATPAEYAEAEKMQWLANHPCRKQDGSRTIHKQGKCANCNCCFTCKSPPWCTEHVKKEDPRYPKRPDLSIGNFLSPTKKLRQRPPETTDAPRVSPMMMVEINKQVEDKIDEVDEFADEEKAENNLLGNLFCKQLNDIENIQSPHRVQAFASTVEKQAKALAKIVKLQLRHLCKNKVQELESKALNFFMEELCEQWKETQELLKNSATLMKEGSANTKRVILPLLLSSFRTDCLQSRLIDLGYPERRMEQATANRVIPTELARKFKSPVSNTISNATHRRNFKVFLCKGLDIPRPSPRTKVNIQALTSAVAYIYSNSEYRPGQLRHPGVRGSPLKNMPVFRRYTPIDDLFAQYRASEKVGPPLGYNSFREVVHALTLKGGVNQGLSYYYTDFIEGIALLQLAIARMKEIAGFCDDDTIDSEKHLGEPKDSILILERQTTLVSKFLRHQFYGRLKETAFNNKNMYCSVKWLLGSTDVCKPAAEEKDPLLLVFTLRPLIHWISDLLQESLEEEDSPLKKEVQSFKEMANILEKEFLHYTKHLIRGWWQERKGFQFKNKLLKEGVVFVTLDHKSKTLPMKKKEAMSDYFAKHGMSDLGCMIEWYGRSTKSAEIDGTYTWFIDIIMSNVKSQKAQDLMPGLEAVLDQLESPEFIGKFSKTSGQDRPKQIVLVSDNALKSTVHTPYITLLNSRRTVKIRDWLNNEAQRGKSFLDTHFRYVNQQLLKAVLDGNIDLSNPKAFYDCLVFKGGIKASSVLLLQEDPIAEQLFKVCKNIKYKSTGISKVHHISWGEETVVHRHFTNLKSINNGYKEFNSQQLLPETDIESCGTVLKKFHSDTDPLFLPLKLDKACAVVETAAFAHTVGEKPPPKGTFAEQLYIAAGFIHGRGVTPEQLLVHTPSELKEMDYKRSKMEEKEIEELLLHAKGMIDEDMDPNEFKFPPNLTRYWAEKRNKNWMKFSKEVLAELKRMYDQGKGYKNQGIRYNAEKAVPELHEEIFADRWDQRAVITVKAVKSQFSSWAAEEKKLADKEEKGALPVAAAADDDEDEEKEEPEDNETEWLEDLGLPIEDNEDDELFEENPDQWAL